MKKKNLVSLSVLILSVILLTMPLISCTGSEKEVFELRLAHFFGASHPAETVLIRQWSEALAEATEGRIKIESYAGGTLLGANDIYNGVVEGVADIGMSCFAYTPGRFPIMEAFELPGITYLNSRVASMVAWEGINELNPPEVQDTKMLMVLATGPGDLFTRSPVRSLADLQGLEIRATGISSDTISALGGIPLGMSQNDAYDSLAKGVVQGNLSPIEVLQGWNQAEVTSYITRTPFLYNTLFFITMNLDKWNSLPDDLQKIFLEINERFQEETAAALWDTQNESALIYAVEEHDMEIFDLDAAETALWIDKVMPIQDAYRQKLAGLGIDTDPLAKINELAAKYNELYD